MVNPRKAKKRTGAAKRRRKQQLGQSVQPDESTVRSAQDAKVFLIGSGRSALTEGMSLRVSEFEDVTAFGAIQKECKARARAFAERLLTPAMVAGVEPIVRELDEMISFGNADEQLEEGMPDQIAVARAAKFAGIRRAAIGRIAKGPRHRALRHAFGMNEEMRADNLTEVRRACVALLAGRAAHPRTLAARLISAADVKTAKAYIAQLDAIRSQSGARRTDSAELSRTRDVLHAALELFYDRFGACVELVYENDAATRVTLLSLIPRRRERRADHAGTVPAIVSLPSVASGETD